jgi:hypothetical protein|tara:strand:+ start:5523 stop:6575 length:1053 start_codon:yes stop_codon:yes gene_type:complete
MSEANITTIPTIPVKRGRGRPKVDKSINKNDSTNLKSVTGDNNTSETVNVPKKRGRKPKGGKIVPQNILTLSQDIIKPSVILHLKCSLRDLEDNTAQMGLNDLHFSASENNTFQFSQSKQDLVYEIIENPNTSVQPSNTTDIDEVQQDTNNMKNVNVVSEEKDSTKEIWTKLKQLEKDLHLNNITNTKSACFWCSYDFDNPPIYIPSSYIRNSYQVYGCFCTPECAVAHLMNQNIDKSVKFERYSLINNIYCKIFEHSKNIKPAPDPHYFLDRFYGNMTIQEYRSLLKSDRLLLVIDKPISKVMPEIHEDDDEYMINNKIIPSNTYQVKKRNVSKQTKNNIVNETFGLNH